MNTIDLTPLYQNTVGFDRLANLIDNVMTAGNTNSNYPPYNIEVLDNNRYTIVLAVAGFSENDLDIKIDRGVLTIQGNKINQTKSKYLYQGIVYGTFERKFDLADYIEVTSASLNNGLLTINLIKEIPEAMKPKTISINKADKKLEI